jgi:aspartate/methionine/tyrosine aminotransferase
MPEARPAVQSLRGSKIREVANAGFGDPDVLPFWFGEPDEVTPEFIREAAIEALHAGDTFYTHNLGIAPLREALAAYGSRLHRPIDAERVAVTNSGMSALMLATQAIVGPGDRVVEVTPLWPNLVEIPKILGASVECVPLAFGARGWTLDLDRLLAALTPGTRALYVNSPNNPAGRSTATRKVRSSRNAGGTASGSSPTTPTSASTSRTARPPRRRSSTSPSRTTGWSARTRSRRTG